MTVLQRLHGEDTIGAELQACDAEKFHYNPNIFGIVFAGVIGAVLLATAYYFGRSASFSEITNIIATIVSIGGGLFFTLRAMYWYGYAKERFVAVSDTYLFIGKKDEAWRIAWSILDKKSVGISDMKLSKLKGSFTIEIAKEQIPLHLFNAFAYLDRIEEFMFHILNHLAENEENVQEEE